MKATLIKDEDGYNLMIYGRTFATTDFRGVHPSANSATEHKLSLNNCQSIENGYDLDELGREACNITDPLRLDSQKYKQDPYFRIGFNKGFQKAMEILGDKKFSKYDMLDFAEFFMNLTDKSKPFQKLKDWESLQQNSWDVEVEQELIQSSIQGEAIWELKLDKDGCLILKRK